MSARPPATLAADLRARDDASLAALLRARPDLLSPVPSDLSSLAARATTPSSVRRALEALDRFQVQVLEVVCALPEPVTGDAVSAALGPVPGDDGADGLRARAAVGRALASLREQALVFGDPADRSRRGGGAGAPPSWGLLVPRTVAELLGRPAGLGPPAAEVLSRYGPRRLARITADLGAPPAEVFGDPQRLADLLDSAPRAAREALETLTWGPPSGRLDNALREVDADSAASPVDWLLARGLLVAVDPFTVVLPREVGLHVRGGRVHRVVEPEVPPAETAPVDGDRVDRTAAGAAATVVRQVEDLLELWSAAPPRVLRAGGVGVRDRSRSAAALEVDDATLALLAEVAYAAGLLASGEDGLDEVWLPTPAFDDWLGATTADRWLTLVSAWRDSPRAVGLVGATDDRGRTLTPLGPDLARSSAVGVRREVLADLAALPRSEAATTQSLVERLRWRHPVRAGRLQDDLVTWTVREAGALGLATGGALAEHGRHLATGADAAAAAALTDALPPLLDHVLIQGDLTAIAPGPLQPDLSRRLRLVADVESTGGATVYRFSEASVRRAFDAGWTSAEVGDLLATASRTEVPQALRYLIDDVARRHGRVRVGAAGAYVRCDDETTLHELLGDRRASSLRLRRIAATVVAAQAAPDVVLGRLREMGYAPAAEGEGGDVVVTRPESRRTPGRPPAPIVHGPPEPAPGLVTAAIAAVRAGDRAMHHSPWEASTGQPGAPRRPTADVIAILSSAAMTGESVWIGYVDAEGRGSQRVIEPVVVEGGHVSAYDHLRAAMRTFAVHRITGVSTIDTDLDEVLDAALAQPDEAMGDPTA
jgi:hypothetical protein